MVHSAFDSFDVNRPTIKGPGQNSLAGVIMYYGWHNFRFFYSRSTLNRALDNRELRSIPDQPLLMVRTEPFFQRNDQPCYLLPVKLHTAT